MLADTVRMSDKIEIAVCLSRSKNKMTEAISSLQNYNGKKS